MANTKQLEVQSRLEQGWQMPAVIRQHQVLIDQPKHGGGQDQGPTPLEYFLFAMTGCIGTVAKIVAHQDRIKLHSIEVKVSGDIDMDGLMGRSPEAPVGFTRILIEAQIDAELSVEEKQAFLDKVCHRCPLHANLTGATKLENRLI
ncbi:OsmC family protein [Pontibacter sp. JAM-7]|uniref:OsmC family protein n=1 Tax=Pontibacter sp. JAM-7 TaxID=3366581 RepID=UPI003AF9ED09